MNELTGLLIDTTGIQKYIFSSNKLRLNLGASYIIEHLLMDKLLVNTLNTFTSSNEESMGSWLIKTEDPQLNDEDIGLGYAGGGRCLLFCKDKETAKAFAAKFSQETMLNFPGITLSATTLSYDKIPRNAESEKNSAFQNFMSRINQELNKDRSNHHIISSPMSPGYVRKDSVSEGYVDPVATKISRLDLKPIGDKQTAISTLSKLAYVDKANDQHMEHFLNKANYEFPLELDDVCMEDDQGFIAIAHIDGNGIGRQFMELKTMKEYQELSGKVKEIGKKTITKTVEDLIFLLETGHEGSSLVTQKIKEFQEKKMGSGKIYLPFRPIISGGDDITFVTDGRLGIYLAERCVENFISTTKDVLGEEFHACAGVAIVKRKYPFARAYHLAEQLISNAKKSSRAPIGEKYSYIDMYLSKSGISGSLEYIRSQTHKIINAGQSYYMNYGPYLIQTNQDDGHDKPTFKEFIARINETLAPASRSKIQQLRDTLYGSKKDREMFMARLGVIDNEFKNKLDKNGGTDGDLFRVIGNTGDEFITPWIDAIDFKNFYPFDHSEIGNHEQKKAIKK